MAVTIAGLMCHAPIVVPAVGGERGRDCATTTTAMRDVARRLVASAPDVLVVLSPHTPRARASWGLVDGERVRGDLSAFGATGMVDLPAAPTARERLASAAGTTVRLPAQRLDHGAIVPLWFLVEAGWRGPTLVVAWPWDDLDPVAFGQAIAAASAGERWAVLGSGDLSHRLRPGAPSGFDPRAQRFDDTFVAALRARDPHGAASIDPSLRELAAEDVVTSVAVAWAAAGLRTDGAEVLAYEGPYGVGYCEAVLFEEVA